MKDISRLAQVDTVDSKTLVTAANVTKIGMSYPNFKDYARENQVFGPQLLCWPVSIDVERWHGAQADSWTDVSANYFDVLGLSPSSGRFFLPDEDTKPAAIIRR